MFVLDGDNFRRRLIERSQRHGWHDNLPPCLQPGCDGIVLKRVDWPHGALDQGQESERARGKRRGLSVGGHGSYACKEKSPVWDGAEGGTKHGDRRAPIATDTTAITCIQDSFFCKQTRGM